MSKKIFSLVVNCIWVVVSACVMIMTTLELETMVQSIINNLELNVPLHIILQQESMSTLLMFVVLELYSGWTLFRYAHAMFQDLYKINNRSKEERDAENFIKWVKKEQKRLRKLEGTC